MNKISPISLLTIIILVVIATALIYTFNQRQPAELQDVSIPINITSKPTQQPIAHFTDITEESGIYFKHINGVYGEKLLPETMGHGAAFFDYDNDNDQDLLLINGRYWAEYRPAEANKPTTLLYQNDGKGHFKAVQVGLELHHYGMGVAVVDYDNKYSY